jgi:hypothetical protein
MPDHDDQEKFLNDAIKAFQLEAQAAAACLKHREGCWLCRHPFLARFVSVVVRCIIRELQFEHMTAKVDADEYRQGILELTDTPSVEWCVNLYRLEDKRETRSGS